MLSSVYDRPRTRSIAMKPTCETRRLICAVLALGALSLTTRANASAGDFYNSDHQARVIAHLPLSGAGATQMFLRKQGRDQYLYVQRPSQQGFTVINVTKPERPKVVRRVPLETRTIMGSGFVVTETPDLSAARKASGAAGNGEGEMVPESIHIVDISDSAPSRTVQTFNGANIFSPVRVDASDAEWDAALLQVVTLPHFLRLAFKSAARSVQSTGRLPVRTRDEARTVVAKILQYERNENLGDWINQVLMVADRDDPTTSFTQAAKSVQVLLPKSLKVTDVFAAELDPKTAGEEIIAGINRGKLIVNYTGHGSVEVWSGEDLLDDRAAESLTNGSLLPVFLMMNCLNGFFHDVYTESLAQALLFSKNGGAVAVWASSGLTSPEPQFQLDQNVVKLLFSQPPLSLGDATRQAKSDITDSDARRTYILFGDPLLSLKRSTVGNNQH